MNEKREGLFWDWFWVVVFLVGFQGLLFGATKLESWLGWDLFQLVDVLAMLAKLFTLSAGIWLFTRLIFPNTIGRDFGVTFNSGWEDFSSKEKTGWTIAVFLVIFFALASGGRASVRLALPVSEEGLELIEYYEVGGQSYYQSILSRPTWPGGASGVTVGFGYDLGYNSRAGIARDWQGVATAGEIAAMQSVAGLKGSRAKSSLYKIRNRVHISYEQASLVFQNQTLPRFAKLTASAFRIQAGRLNEHCNAALVSLVFNRGGKVDYSPQRREMAFIRHNLSIRKDSRVPGDIRAMKRLWVGRGLDGLLKRRDAEARLFEKGLKS